MRDSTTTANKPINCPECKSIVTKRGVLVAMFEHQHTVMLSCWKCNIPFIVAKNFQIFKVDNITNSDRM